MKSIVTLIIINLILIACPVMLVSGSDWKLIRNEDGIALYSREVSGHSELEFKGVCLVNQPIEVMGAVLSDIPSYPKWFFKCSESKKITVENTSELNFYLYIAIDTPWPFSDRDVVYNSNIAIDYALGKVVIRSTALAEQFVPLRRGYVRITDSEHQWILEGVSSIRTRITFINRTHAAGSFANYISDPGTRDTTLHSLKNLINIVKDPKYTHDAKELSY
jgi:hypothetical protein